MLHVPRYLSDNKEVPDADHPHRAFPERTRTTNVIELSNKAAIVGVGATPYTKKATRSPVALAAEAISNAIADAGLDHGDIDGLISYSFDPVTEMEVQNCLGWQNLRYFTESSYGSGATAVGHAAMAVAAGQANYVVVFRAISGRYGDAPPTASAGRGASGDVAFYAPFGMQVPAHWVSLTAQRYLHEYNADSRAFGWISVTSRKHGATNPLAVNYQFPITIEDHQNSRFIAEPLRLFDCTPNTEGATAVVVTTGERAADLPNIPAKILAFGQGTGSNVENNTNYNRKRIVVPEESLLTSRELYARTGLGPADIDVVQIYDHFTPLVLIALEAWGFCGEGEGQDFVEGGQRITIGGDAPLNTSGGHLGEGYFQIMGHIVDSVRQLRGTAVNQVPDAEVALITGTNLPTGALILTK